MAKSKYTKESIKQRIQKEMPKSDIEIIEYSGIIKPAIIYCNKCGSTLKYSTMDKIIDRGRRGLKNACKICEDTKSLTPRLKQIQKLNKILLENPNIKLLDKDVSRLKDKLTFKCEKCNNTFKRNVYEFFKSQKCPYCEGMISKHDKDTFIKKMQVHNIIDYELIGEFKGTSVSTLFKHKKCGFIWKTTPGNILSGHGCPKCKMSEGETYIANLLSEMDINYFSQYKFKNSSISNLPFDFYIEKDNKKFCIEYQGEQHYKSIDYFGGEEKFLKQKNNDSKKKEFCQRNNIILIEIPYFEFNNIKKILNFWFNDQSKDVDSSESKYKPSKDEDIV